MKKIISLVVVVSLVLCGLGAVAEQFDLKKIDTKSWEQIQPSSLSGADVLDQYQLAWDMLMPVGYYNYDENYYIIAQTFTPTFPVLTRVELLIFRNLHATYDYTVAIRDDLNGTDLTSINVPASEIPTDNYSWEEFDFPDIMLTPGNTYYIVSSTANATDNFYAWCFSSEDVYPYGNAHFSPNGGANWVEYPCDMTFKTYGRWNNPPDRPLITGKTDGKVGVEYAYNFSTDDFDGDDVYYWIEWGDNSSAVEWSGPYASGMIVTVKHTFAAKGTYTIQAKAKDTLWVESTWGYLEVTMPCSYNIPLQWFWERVFERFPNAFPILRHMMGY